MARAENRVESGVAGNTRTFLTLEVRGAIHPANNIGGFCPDVVFAQNRHRHRITRP